MSKVVDKEGSDRYLNTRLLINQACKCHAQTGKRLGYIYAALTQKTNSEKVDDGRSSICVVCTAVAAILLRCLPQLDVRRGFTSITVFRLMRINQGLLEHKNGFRPASENIDHSSTGLQILERQSCIQLSDLKSAFDSVDRLALWPLLWSKAVLHIFSTLFKGLPLVDKAFTYNRSTNQMQLYC
ncbi:hypothetical protein CLF_102360 [Clonorchis sinensis]|uniref:Reverse transcriptase domain-containing protein n=1 Tax=Clonorchis sinensis TaxID=79923 RepID=G7Y7R2_CLOSI|nr:hypothetical protein CLF_102360 [Clonorchis sinensis]